jgi:hypothetical protein
MSTRPPSILSSQMNPIDANGRPAEPDSEERERQKNNFFHAWSILRAMTEDRGRAGARVTEAEQALDVDQVKNPENPSTALAKEFSQQSARFDLRNGMIDEYLESKREKLQPGKKQAVPTP